MDIIKTNMLTAPQQQEITALEAAVYKKHKLQNHATLHNDINFDRVLPCFYLGYVGQRLVAFLSIFMPTSKEAEIVAFTHPDFQNKGCFSLLLEQARAVLRRAKIAQVLFAVEPRSKSAMAVLRTFSCFEPERTEYRMAVSNLSRAPDATGIQLFEVDHSNQALFRTAIATVFPETAKEMDNFYSSLVENDLRRGYIVYTDRPIGVFNFSMEQGVAFLYGVGIAAEYRGRGFGKKLVGCAMREGLKLADTIILDVDSDNPIAYNLYCRCGFEKTFWVEYYRYTL